MSIQSEITRISGNVSDAFTAITNKGVTVPAGSTSDDLADLISQISGGGGGAISIVDTPDSAGGTVRTITAVDISSDTVTAAHLETGYTAHDAEGNPLTGTLSPGGGGLEYETGTYTPTEDVVSATISFSNTHTAMPAVVIMAEASDSLSSWTNYSLFGWNYIHTGDLFGGGYPRSNSSLDYGRVDSIKKSNTSSLSLNNVTSLQYPSSETSDTAPTYPRYWVTASSFKAYAANDLYYWRSGRTYKWIAIWAPSP
jgi:hypothetical protein